MLSFAVYFGAMRTLWSIAFMTFLLSFGGKIAVDRLLTERRELLGSFVSLTYSENPGIAFGILFPPIVQIILILTAIVLVIVMAITGRRTVLSRCGYGSIIGGALCNIVDRSLDGLVTDFIAVGSFPIFNIADSAISVGVGLLLIDVLRSHILTRRSSSSL